MMEKDKYIFDFDYHKKQVYKLLLDIAKVEMKNKYYTPKIEEFHVGFEYERKSLSFEKKFTKGIIYAKFDNGIWDANIDFELSMLLDGAFEYRVKYLDKEDIESLELKCIIENQYIKDDITLLIDSDYFIQIIKDHYNEDAYLFQGTIKNKSELKKLLKQLGIWRKQ